MQVTLMAWVVVRNDTPRGHLDRERLGRPLQLLGEIVQGRRRYWRTGAH